jgi:predicted transcriptional regulator of viral defense system
MGRTPGEYAVYKGEELLYIGTIQECAERMNVSPNTVRFYASPAHEKRVFSRKRPKKYLIVVKLD